MCSVFQISCLTISALAASKCNHGIFLRPSLELPLDGKCDPSGIKLQPAIWGVTARPEISHDILPNTMRTIGETGHSPLLKRAWVYQERLLSQRILHFGDTQMI